MTAHDASRTAHEPLDGPQKLGRKGRVRFPVVCRIVFAAQQEYRCSGSKARGEQCG
jgi:hypothetical protein